MFVMGVGGGSVEDLVEVPQTEAGTPVRPARVCTYLSQTAKVLDFLNTRQHRIGGQLVAFRHCDVKPSNMLLFNGTVKLADFGVAVMTASVSQRHPPCG